ncbi:hypothetical protein M378DRAFT_172378 [Amanita muscaria Koide BX008]|uniref:Uncharacterized protein n=1 Tax=Amanita muscaria (strain Koide BX008) TaxID=946122 RepID=A0A0C2SRZ4_AMAMK|nr:hypothetical protein M378DRAFT_172378 [Amanita muscaria Koide BX008]
MWCSCCQPENDWYCSPEHLHNQVQLPPLRMPRNSHTDLELGLTNANITADPGPGVPTNGRTLVKSISFKPSLNFLVMIFTLNIPTFHASLGRISGGLGIRPAISVWKAVRTLDSLLVAVLIAVLFKADTLATPSFWFLCSCSLLQAVIGLISSTALIIYFSAYPTNNDDVEVGAVLQLKFLFWSVWDLFSVPSIWTSWSVVTFTITLLINVACPTTLNGVVDVDATDYSNLESARALFVVLICVSAVFFGFFLFHLRHLSRIL